MTSPTLRAYWSWCLAKIKLDKRSGSVELLGYFPTGTVEVCLLEFGDAAFPGKGPKGPVEVGVERKTITDLIQCMEDGRLVGHQLPGLLNTYDYVYLVLEGVYYLKRDKVKINLGNKKYRTIRVGSRSLDPFLNTLEVAAGVIVRQTDGRQETAELIRHLYQWWQKDFERHTRGLELTVLRRPGLTLKKPSLVARVAKELPMIGPEKAMAVAERFDTVLELVQADQEAWEEISGIGPTLARCAVEALRE